ncbi:MAG: hypothetical protein QNJ34_10535 [Xenococcaceae cyanobacterium MO_188.B29]|nr:hypothetical protein [Xenococcaceae cyanobacterium MO_188.B29]
MIQLNNQESNFFNRSNPHCSSSTLLDIHLPTIQTIDAKGFERLQSNQLFNYHLDYLSFTLNYINRVSFQALLDFIDIQQNISILTGLSWSAGHKARNYKNTILSTTGIKGGFDHLNDSDKYQVMIIISGSYFANLSAIEQQKLIVYLHLIWGIEPNRLDIAIDDYTFKAIPLTQGYFILTSQRINSLSYTLSPFKRT